MASNPEPPDGGWGWVMVICGFIHHMFTVGLMMSLSVFYVSWLDQFGESKGDTSWIVSIGVACMFGLCPIPAALAVRLGFRIVAFIGAVLTSSGLILSVFATSVTYLVVSIGLITGIGCCLSYLPAMAIVAMYFDKRRSLAMGLNTAGAGIGAFILAPLLNILEEMYGWRGAILLLGGITLHACVTSMLMRSLEVESEDKMLEETFEKNKETQRNEASERLLKERPKADLAVNPMTNVIHHAEDHVPSLHLQIHSASKRETPLVDKTDDGDINELLNKESKRDELVHQPFDVGYCFRASYGDLRDDSFLLSKRGHRYSFPIQDARTFDRKYGNRLISRSAHDVNIVSATSASTNSHLNEKERFGASPPHDANDLINENNDVQENLEKSTYKRNCSSSILSSKIIKANLDLLSNKSHVAFCVSQFITNLSYITPVVFMVDRAVYQGISKSAGAILVSANGIGNVVGRIFFGLLAYRLRTRPICMYISALIVCGVGTMLSDLCGNFIVLHTAYASFFGLLIGTYTVLAPIVCADLVGVSVFATAYGQANFFMGVGSIFGPPFAGWLFDWTGSYLLSYLAMGFFLVMSGVMLFPLLCRNNKIPSRTTRDDSDFPQERDHER